MSGIAEVLLNLGFEVSGSDLKSSEITENLEGLGARVTYEHLPENIEGADVVVFSSAVAADNPEVVEASRRTIPTIPRTELLAELMRLKFAITVAGSHGKTSTTSLISAVLASGGLDPTVVVGGKLKALRSNARLGSGRYLVAEADESDGKFVQLPSTIAVISNIDYEHLDHYHHIDAIKDGFVQYANRVPFYGSVVLCVDDGNVRSILARIRKRKITYAMNEAADVEGDVVSRDSSGCTVSLNHNDVTLGEIHVSIPGDHYAQNALAAVAVGLELDIPFSMIKEGIETFKGVGRRFEVKGTAGGVLLVDDYGHHPTEVAATVRAAVQHLGKRPVVIFQPHRYSRTQALAEEFATCFDEAKRVFITEIYPAGEKPIRGISADTIISRVKKSGGVQVEFAPSLDAVVEMVSDCIEDGDVVLTLGAGDIYTVCERLFERLNEKDA
jgi:UDP-N-acetylmuramate--alanine ligase